MNKLKNILSVVVVLATFHSHAQVSPGTSCATAGCSMSGTYSNQGFTSPSMGQYGCLYSTPNPGWLALGIGTSGSVHLQLTQTNNNGNLIDVDFALYGPFSSVSAGCPITSSTPQVDCSYSASGTEYVDITNAIAGQVYILLVTNYNGSAGNITLQQSPNQSSSATINCSINFSATTSQTPASCGQATGSVTATPNGGFAPYTYSWNIPGNPTTQTVTGVAPGTYTVTITSSPNPANGQIVNPTTATVTVANINPTYSATSTSASCQGGANGTATANHTVPGNPTMTATYLWNDPAGQTTKTATGLLPGTYSCTITLANGCVGNVTVTVGANNVTYNSTSTLVSCPGGADGTATATMTPVIGTLSYLWDDPAGQTSATATGLSAGTYTCTVTSNIGCTGTTTVTVSEIPGMVGTFTTKQNVTCNSKNDGVLTINVTQGTPPYAYSWDHSASTIHSANDLFVGPQTVTVTDNRGCVMQKSETLTEPDLLAITFLTEDTIICPEHAITLKATGSGGSSNYIFTWRQGTTILGVGDSMVVDPENSGTEYCVELSEVCGSPATDSCMTITFPDPIVPLFNVNKPYTCLPGELVFENVSNFEDQIDSMIVDFGNLTTQVFYGNTDITYTYTEHGLYTLHVTAISDRGCTTTGTFPGIANVLPNPIANFNMTANPTTIFETRIGMLDNSSSDVVDWQWSAIGAEPNQSTAANPIFHYPEGVVGTYEVTLIVETNEGCVDTITKLLSVISDIIFYAPNTFTPDGDEFNQTWKFFVQGVDEYNFELLIFDRWGELVWETHDVNSTWDGTYNGRIAPFGTYTWVARVKDIYSDAKKTYTGSINLIR